MEQVENGDTRQKSLSTAFGKPEELSINVEIAITAGYSQGELLSYSGLGQLVSKLRAGVCVADLISDNCDAAFIDLMEALADADYTAYEYNFFHG